MDMLKLYEVMDSEKREEILYKNRPIWIEAVNEEKGIAKIQLLDTQQYLTVSIQDLKATGETSYYPHPQEGIFKKENLEQAFNQIGECLFR